MNAPEMLQPPMNRRDPFGPPGLGTVPPEMNQPIQIPAMTGAVPMVFPVKEISASMRPGSADGHQREMARGLAGVTPTTKAFCHLEGGGY